MKWLNYNHLYYFWIVAREGSIARAAEELMVSQPTISIQIKELETAVGQRLFDRVGRGLQLTEAGRIALNYANEIFSLGQEMTNALEHQPAGRSLKLSVGILDVIPKVVVRQILDPALHLPQPVRLICREDKADRLLADLAARRKDVVLSDAPIKRGFPKSLNGQPVLLPSDHTQVRRSLNQWFDSKRIHPVVAGEFDDSALMFWFGRTGHGVFPAPTVIEADIRREMGLELVGRLRDVRERFYAITLDEKPKHPAVVAICRTRLGKQ